MCTFSTHSKANWINCHPCLRPSYSLLLTAAINGVIPVCLGAVLESILVSVVDVVVVFVVVVSFFGFF